MSGHWICSYAFGLILVSAVLFPGLTSGAATLKLLVAGKRGAVAAGHPLVAEAGLRILDKGGNAVDAGVATVFAGSVVEMTSFGAGGECPVLIKLQNRPGFPLNATLEHNLQGARCLAENWSTTAKVYYPGGRVAKEGEIVVQADLAHTFQSMVEAEKRNVGKGRNVAIEAVRDYFYRGPLAKRISDFC